MPVIPNLSSTKHSFKHVQKKAYFTREGWQREETFMQFINVYPCIYPTPFIKSTTNLNLIPMPLYPHHSSPCHFILITHPHAASSSSLIPMPLHPHHSSPCHFILITHPHAASSSSLIPMPLHPHHSSPCHFILITHPHATLFSSLIPMPLHPHHSSPCHFILITHPHAASSSSLIPGIPYHLPPRMQLNVKPAWFAPPSQDVLQDVIVQYMQYCQTSLEWPSASSEPKIRILHSSPGMLSSSRSSCRSHLDHAMPSAMGPRQLPCCDHIS